MKLLKLFLSFVVIVGLVLILLHYKNAGLFVATSAISTSTPSTTNTSTQSASSTVDVECHDSPKYFAVQQSLAPLVGSTILIKYKTTPNQNVACAYTVAPGDFEIQNVSAEYFLTFTDNFLVLDSGTAPEPRKLIVYNLRSRSVVFTDSYAKPVTVTGDSITYFSETKQKPTIQNCPDLKSYQSNGLGAVIMSKITVDLTTLSKKESGTTECLATQ